MGTGERRMNMKIAKCESLCWLTVLKYSYWRTIFLLGCRKKSQLFAFPIHRAGYKDLFLPLFAQIEPCILAFQERRYVDSIIVFVCTAGEVKQRREERVTKFALKLENNGRFSSRWLVENQTNKKTRRRNKYEERLTSSLRQDRDPVNYITRLLNRIHRV